MICITGLLVPKYLSTYGTLRVRLLMGPKGIDAIWFLKTVRILIGVTQNC